ncbi:Dipeptidyl aminopeptidase/acylaminoacyl peptidase [Sphingomonas guangdongensis]|uniref:Dipeptidyl aminopeptidase/acylaminoacyl peptidase n=1 Tax=Sphingomonas guangdongensis TaxID=1141890 RepID=A0A285R218_9SPHN|nr:S9 family peptidase [Sphingomonas guangdongensis]SOB88131.1 Dipeptidyl aminopeptidase/acylaminoacyl peptidase [Sphingomonas guangdongensis]
MKSLFWAAAGLSLAAVPAAARTLTIKDVTTLSRVGAPAVSKDGRWLVWQQRETDLANNRGRFDLWRLDLRTRNAAPQKLAAEAEVNETAPEIGSDGTVYFLSDKGGDDNVWSVPLAGGAARQVTSIPGGIGGFRVAPTLDKLLVFADRKPGAPSLEQPQVKRDPNVGSARIYDQLFVRHWDAWATGDRSQIFVLPLAGGVASGWGTPIVGQLAGDTPSKPFGGTEEIAWSADGRTVYFALREAGRIEATSTNLDIFAAPADGSAAPTNLSADNDATDTFPSVSPDGRWLAWAAMKRAGYEADKLTVMLRNLATGEVRALTEAWDRSASSIAWAPDSRTIYVTADDTGEAPLFGVDVTSGKVTRLTQEGHVSMVAPTAGGVVFASNSLVAPDDFWMARGRGKPVQLTRVNAAKLAGIEWPEVNHFSFTGANGDKVWGYALKPAGLAAGAKAPVAFIIHGGPQGSMSNGWSYRWNPALFTGAGYATVFVDFHGSTGYGQAFTDAIRNNWGGWPLEDLQKGLAAAGERFAWADTGNACALGASYGGYMVNWIAGNWADRFKCLVQHDGVFDARAMAYETEELWFDEWEHGGKAYFEDPAAFERWNPVNHVAQWRSPMLVITGERDFRIPYTQGLATFTALQRREIPSRLIVFPDENHWVLKPRNSRQWYGEVLGWLGRWTGRAASSLRPE